MNFFKDLTEAEKKTLTAWGIGGLIIFLCAIFFKVTILDKQNVEDAEKPKLDTHFSIVKDYNRYYTVSVALERYYQYINNENTDALLKVLNPDYIKSKKITKDNVLDFVDNSDIAITFEHKMMCKKTYDVGKTRYLFKVKEVPLFLMDGDDFTDIKDPSLTYAYYQIDLDGNTSTYNVKPISEKVYGDDCHE